MGKLFLAASVFLVGATAFAATDEYSRVEIKGTLHNDVQERRASINANGVTYELDLGNSREMAMRAEQLDRQPVVVNGRLFIEKGSKGDTFLVVTADELNSAGGSNVSYERREVIQEPRRVIVKERRSPIFKAGPLEINP